MTDNEVAILPPVAPSELMETGSFTDYGSSQSMAARQEFVVRAAMSLIQTDIASHLQDALDGTLSRLDLLIMGHAGEMWDQMDSQRDSANAHIQGDVIVVGFAGAAASSFSIGYVAWALRSGFLLSGLLAHLPAWQSFDTLSIMQGLTGGRKAETLEELVDRKAEGLKDSTPADSAA